MRISTCASLIDFITVSTCKNDNSRHINTIDGGVGKLASTRYAHTLAVGSAQTFRTLSSEVALHAASALLGRGSDARVSLVGVVN